MNVLLISTNQVKGFRPAMPIGMISVASSLLKHGHSVNCVDLCFENRCEEKIKNAINDFHPDVIGFSIRNIDNQNFLDPSFILPPVKRYVKLVRKWSPHIVLVLGGPAFTLMPDEMMRYLQADYGISGPGERNFVELLERIERKENTSKIHGLVSNKNTKPVLTASKKLYSELGDLSTSDIDLYDKRYFSHIFNGPTPIRHAAFPIIGKRGCVYSCIYCANSLIAGTKIKLKEPSKIVDEIEKVINHSEAKYFEFVDGAFNAPYNHALAVCKEMKKRKINHPWLCMFNPGNATEELLDLMVETGCKIAELGTECGSNKILKNLQKNFTVDDIKRTHRMLSDRGIKAEHCVFIGSPGETKETVLDTFKMLEELVPHKVDTINRVFISLGYRIFKNTPLYEIAIKEKVINETDNLVVPKFYIAPEILHDDSILDLIEQKVSMHTNWFMWWGFSKYSLKERIRLVKDQFNRMNEEISNQLIQMK